MSTKDFSSVQEHSIANSLGWKVVSGSGARNFHPGDIVSESGLENARLIQLEKMIFHLWLHIGLRYAMRQSLS